MTKFDMDENHENLTIYSRKDYFSTKFEKAWFSSGKSLLDKSTSGSLD